MIYPSPTLFPAPQRLYEILCAAGPSGIAQGILAEKLGRGLDKASRKTIAYSVFSVRCGLEPFGLTVAVRRVTRYHTHYAIVPLDLASDARPDEAGIEAVSDDDTVIAGIPSYRHRIGRDFEGCDVVVSLPRLSCFTREVRP